MMRCVDVTSLSGIVRLLIRGEPSPRIFRLYNASVQGGSTQKTTRRLTPYDDTKVNIVAVDLCSQGLQLDLYSTRPNILHCGIA